MLFIDIYLFNHHAITLRRILQVNGKGSIGFVWIGDFSPEVGCRGIKPSFGWLCEDLEVVSVHMHGMITNIPAKNEPVVNTTIGDDGCTAMAGFVAFVECGVCLECYFGGRTIEGTYER